MKHAKQVFILLPFIICGCTLRNSLSDRMERVENGLLPPVIIKESPPFNLTERMEHYKVPGVSIVVIKDFRIDWGKNYGVIDVETQKPVTDETLFGVGSMSKSLTAMAVLRKAEEGRLDLGGNVNYQLISWKLPENEFTRIREVTVRYLLNHSGGVMYSPSFGYTLEEMPTLLQILRGEQPAKSRPVIVDKEPGTGFQYSNAGYTILQQLLIDIEREPFTEIMEETVLEPLEMSNSTFEQPLSPQWEKFAASGHRHDGKPVRGKRLIYPHMAAAGLWSNAADMAKFVIELQLSLKNESNKILSAEMTEEMLGPFISENYGLGVFLTKNKGETYFSHAGDVWGFNCVFISHKTDGYGAVVMTNSANGLALHREIIRGIASVYNWKDFLLGEYETVEVDSASLYKYVGRYLLGSDRVLTVSKEDGRLFIKPSYSEKSRLYPISSNKFVFRERNEVLTFVKNSNGEVRELIRQIGKRNYTSKKISEDYKIPFELLMGGAIEKAVAGYRKLHMINPYDYYVSEPRLNNLGYYLLYQEKYTEAIAIFKLNCELYPQSSNVYDSLGEAYMLKGDRELAIKNYEKSLDLNPENTNAVEMLNRLRAD